MNGAIAAAVTGNTVNVAIIVGGVIVAILLALQFLNRNKLKFGNVEIGSPKLGPPIQRIDDTCKLKCRTVVNQLKEAITAELPTKNRVVSEALSSRILFPIYESIQRNHFTRVFSDKERKEEWINNLAIEIHRAIKITEYSVNETWEELHTPEFEKYIKNLVTQIQESLVGPVLEACYAKVETYRKTGDVCKEHIEKNESYIRALR